MLPRRVRDPGTGPLSPCSNGAPVTAGARGRTPAGSSIQQLPGRLFPRCELPATTAATRWRRCATVSSRTRCRRGRRRATRGARSRRQRPGCRRGEDQANAGSGAAEMSTEAIRACGSGLVSTARCATGRGEIHGTAGAGHHPRPAGAPIERPRVGRVGFLGVGRAASASITARYPVQRQRFPFRCRAGRRAGRRSASKGGDHARRAEAALKARRLCAGCTVRRAEAGDVGPPEGAQWRVGEGMALAMIATIPPPRSLQRRVDLGGPRRGLHPGRRNGRVRQRHHHRARPTRHDGVEHRRR